MTKRTRDWVAMLILGCALGCMASPSGQEHLSSASQRVVGDYCDDEHPCGPREVCRTTDNTCQRAPNACTGVTCLPDEVCLEGTCVPQGSPSTCDDSTTCGPNRSCVGGLCQDDSPGGCTDNSQCSDNQYCNDFGRCAFAECHTTDDCAPGWHCVSYSCVPGE